MWPEFGSNVVVHWEYGDQADVESKLASAASARGFKWANPTSRFVGHAVCDDVEWINGLSSPVSESYHPNKPGHSSGYAPTVTTPLTGVPEPELEFRSTRDEFEHMASELRMLVVPQFAFVAHVNGDPAAFMLVVPDYNSVLRRIGNGRLFPTGAFRLLLAKNRLRCGRVMALGVKREYRSTGLSALLMHEVIRRANAYGATEAEASWILEDNALMNRPLVAMGAKEYRRWRIYEKAT